VLSDARSRFGDVFVRCDPDQRKRGGNPVRRHDMENRYPQKARHSLHRRPFVGGDANTGYRVGGATTDSVTPYTKTSAELQLSKRGIGDGMPAQSRTRPDVTHIASLLATFPKSHKYSVGE
jgi:hypothetical protein